MSTVQGVPRPVHGGTSGATRRRPGGREGRDGRIDALVSAATDDLRERGYDGMTVRNAARRAGIAPATAYTYFGSKDHLVAEVFWRRMQRLRPVPADGEARVTRLIAALDDLVEVVAGDPALIVASTTAVLADDPDVAGLRERISARLAEHLGAAFGPDADPAALRVLDLAVSGALLQAGMGFLAREDLPARLHEVARLLCGPEPPAPSPASG